MKKCINAVDKNEKQTYRLPHVHICVSLVYSNVASPTLPITDIFTGTGFVINTVEPHLCGHPWYWSKVAALVR